MPNGHTGGGDPLHEFGRGYESLESIKAGERAKLANLLRLAVIIVVLVLVLYLVVNGGLR